MPSIVVALLFVCPLTVARQRLCKHVPPTANTRRDLGLQVGKASDFFKWDFKKIVLLSHGHHRILPLWQNSRTIKVPAHFRLL
jgi:hypothetical protein